MQRAASGGKRDSSVGARVRVCIVTPSSPAANPRVIKEADALSAAGYAVWVVFGDMGGIGNRDHDLELLAQKNWRWSWVSSWRRQSEPVRWFGSAIAQRVRWSVPASLWKFGLLAERSESRIFDRLTRAAVATAAQLFIGHYPAGLAAAAHAAARAGGALGFDAEDFHVGESNDQRERQRADLLQSRYLDRCAYLTAASEGIADALAARYGCKKPVTIYNTFPLSDRLTLDGRRQDRVTDALSLHWYSQTIGLDRGIQDAIRAAGRLAEPVQIHLRGNVTPAVREALLDVARTCGVGDRLFFHPQVSPMELLSRIAEHDVGLALEQGVVYNRAICTTNKLFQYMLAGLAIVATDVPGQRTALRHEGASAVAFYTPGDDEALAAHLQRWLEDPVALQRAKAAALESAQRRWNWEIESRRLITEVERTLADATAPADRIVTKPIGVLQDV